MDERNHHVVVTGIVVKDGKYLITKRAGNREAFNDRWTVPGGKIEKSDYDRPKDTEVHWYNVLEDVLRREIREETGLMIKNLKYLTSLTFMKGEVPVLVVSMYADHHEGDVVLNDESVDYKWVSLEEAKEYDLIEGIYEELEMLDGVLGGEVGVWGKDAGVVEKVRRFVENECKKPTSKYGYDIYIHHFVQVYNYSKELAEKLGGDVEIVELAAWLHDIGSIIYGREDHQVTGAKIAEEKLRELGYDEDRIEKVKHCIHAHRGSQNISKESVEAQIIADADAMSAFDNIGGQFKATFIYDNMNQTDSRKYVMKKLINSYNKISDDAKKLIKPKFDAVMLLLGEEDENRN